MRTLMPVQGDVNAVSGGLPNRGLSRPSVVPAQ